MTVYMDTSGVQVGAGKQDVGKEESGKLKWGGGGEKKQKMESRESKWGESLSQRRRERRGL
jgi:hypothetical protein